MHYLLTILLGNFDHSLFYSIYIFLISFFSNTFSAISGGGAGLLQLPALILSGVPYYKALASHKFATVALGLGGSLRNCKSLRNDINVAWQILFFGLPNNLTEAETFFGSISSGSSVLLGHLLSLVLTAIIVSSGIKKGIEKVTRYFMPILFIIIVILAIWATSLSGAWEGYKTFLLKFDFNELRNPQTIRNAFRQAFFSLSLGIGIMVTYASYLNKKSNLPKLSVGVASLDTLVGLMAGFITFPIVLTFGLSDAISESTVGALFISIPTGLGSYGAAGRIVAVAFFALAYIAAITSSVSLLEVPVSSLMDKFGFKREKSVWLITLFLFLAGIPSALNLNILGTIDSIFGGVLLIFGGFLVTFFMGWVVPGKFNEELNVSKVGAKTTGYLKFMTRWVAPPIIGFGLFISVFDLLKGWVS